MNWPFKAIIGFLFFQLLIFSFSLRNGNHYTYFASAFLSGRLYLQQKPPVLIDLSYYQGKYSLQREPFPIILLLPFAAIFGTSFQENFLKVPLAILSFILVFKICQKLKVGKNKALLISVFFILGSVYTPVATFPYSSYFSQIVATCAILLAIHEYLSQRRWLVIGIFIALATLTRLELLTSSMFFILALLWGKNKLHHLAQLLLPIFIALILIGFYNLARFDNIFVTGRNHIINLDNMETLKSQGMFSIKHIPANLKYMLIKTPDLVFSKNHSLKKPYFTADPYGTSIFILSPLLLLIFKADFKNRYVYGSFITTAVMLIPIITFYGIGYTQIGYRFALTFFPFLLFPLSSAIKRTPTPIVALLVALGVFITWYFIYSRLAGF